MRSWIDTCVTTHVECSSNIDVELPTRLVDVGLSDSNQLRIYVPKRRTTGRYVALSYCWGDAQTFTSTTKSISTLVQGFSTQSLLRSIRDAITVTRALGVKFLWVDSLCILQGSDEEAQNDWKWEASNMESIY
jgi:hypothetical protein